jgi:hypothetical protein
MATLGSNICSIAIFGFFGFNFATYIFYDLVLSLINDLTSKYRSSLTSIYWYLGIFIPYT